MQNFNALKYGLQVSIICHYYWKRLIKMKYSLESRKRKYFEQYGFLSFA